MRYLKGTDDDLVLEHQWDGHENEVQQEHGETKPSVHLPAEAGDRHDDEQQHHEQDGDRTHHPHRVHLNGLSVDNAVYQPRHW